MFRKKYFPRTVKNKHFSTQIHQPPFPQVYLNLWGQILHSNLNTLVWWRISPFITQLHDQWCVQAMAVDDLERLKKQVLFYIFLPMNFFYHVSNVWHTISGFSSRIIFAGGPAVTSIRTNSFMSWYLKHNSLGPRDPALNRTPDTDNLPILACKKAYN